MTPRPEQTKTSTQLFAFDREAEMTHAAVSPEAGTPPGEAGPKMRGRAQGLAREMLAGRRSAFVETHVGDRTVEAYRLGAYGVIVCVMEEGARREQRRRLLHEGFGALTGRRVEFISYQQLVEAVPHTSPLMAGPATAAGDLQPLRREFESVLADLQVDLSRRQRLEAMLVLSELATNTIQHGRRGDLKVYRSQMGLSLFARDRGPGMRSRDLPFLLFRKGYSSVDGNMGLGYPVIIRLAERVLLSTGPAGTHCLVELALQPSSEDDGDGDD